MFLLQTHFTRDWIRPCESPVGHINATIRQPTPTKRMPETSPISEQVISRKRRCKPNLNAGSLPSMPTIHRCKPERSLDTVLISSPTRQIKQETNSHNIANGLTFQTENSPATPSAPTRRSIIQSFATLSTGGTKMKLLENITSLDDLTPDTLEGHQRTGREGHYTEPHCMYLLQAQHGMY